MEDNLPFDLILIFLKGLIPENKLWNKQINLFIYLYIHYSLSGLY